MIILEGSLSFMILFAPTIHGKTIIQQIINFFLPHLGIRFHKVLCKSIGYINFSLKQLGVQEHWQWNLRFEEIYNIHVFNPP